MLDFEWDSEKARNNIGKHGVSFEEAASAFADAFSLTVHDPNHSEYEDRYFLLGMSFSGRVLVVAHTDRGDVIRIISARAATKTERQQYHGEST